MGSDADLGAGLGGLGAGHGIGVNRGRGVSIMASVAGGCTEEENGERWLDNMVKKGLGVMKGMYHKWKLLKWRKWQIPWQTSNCQIQRK